MLLTQEKNSDGQSFISNIIKCLPLSPRLEHLQRSFASKRYKSEPSCLNEFGSQVNHCVSPCPRWGTQLPLFTSSAVASAENSSCKGETGGAKERRNNNTKKRNPICLLLVLVTLNRVKDGAYIFFRADKCDGTTQLTNKRKGIWGRYTTQLAQCLSAAYLGMMVLSR